MPCLEGIYFSLKYCGVQRKAEAIHHLEPFLHPSTSACVGFGPICVLNQTSFNVWFEPVLPLTSGITENMLTCQENVFHVINTPFLH